ncbi:MAG: hypothetical protein NC328_08315 [Muribaculum sp.]|nr:hypothetical protein [Muribaculum sp.]
MKKTIFALMGLGMLMLASCAGNKEKNAESETVAAADTEVVGMEVETPSNDSDTAVIAGGVVEEEVVENAK